MGALFIVFKELLFLEVKSFSGSSCSISGVLLVRSAVSRVSALYSKMIFITVGMDLYFKKLSIWKSALCLV